MEEKCKAGCSPSINEIFQRSQEYFSRIPSRIQNPLDYLEDQIGLSMDLEAIHKGPQFRARPKRLDNLNSQCSMAVTGVSLFIHIWTEFFKYFSCDISGLYVCVIIGCSMLVFHGDISCT